MNTNDPTIAQAIHANLRPFTFTCPRAGEPITRHLTPGHVKGTLEVECVGFEDAPIVLCSEVGEITDVPLGWADEPHDLRADLAAMLDLVDEGDPNG